MTKKVLCSLLCISAFAIAGWKYLEFRIPELVNAEVERRTKDLLEKNKECLEKINSIETIISKIESNREVVRETFNGINEQKLDAWLDLRYDLKNGRNYEKHLETFEKVFAENEKILAIVNRIVEKSKENEIKAQNFTKFLHKFVRISNIDERELHKVDAMIIIDSMNWRI